MKIIKCIMSWGVAAVIALITVNLVLACYHTQSGWIDRDKGSTLAIFEPGTPILWGTEGRGFHRVDKRGFVNDADELADDYVLAMGASFTQGKEVASGERYTDLLNSYLGYYDKAFVYNVAQDGYYFPDIVRGFTNLTKEFPKADKIIIEIGTTQYSPDELNQALIQREYDEAQNGDRIMSSLSVKKKLVLKLKEYVPLLVAINSRINPVVEESGTDLSRGISLKEYERSLDKIMELFTMNYDGDIIILYHPDVTIDNDGMHTVRNETDEIFKMECEKYGIAFVDMTNDFTKAYEEYYIVPYGFSNTTMGYGHMNRYGHKLVADRLIEYFN